MCGSYEAFISTGSVDTQPWTVYPGSGRSTAADLSPPRLGTGLCGEVSVEEMLAQQGEEGPDQGAFCLLSLLT